MLPSSRCIQGKPITTVATHSSSRDGKVEGNTPTGGEQCIHSIRSRIQRSRIQIDETIELDMEVTAFEVNSNIVASLQTQCSMTVQ